MGYVRITISLADGSYRSGVRQFAEPVILEDVRAHALLLSAESLGKGNILDITVEKVDGNDPAVMALIRSEQRRNIVIVSDGTHPYLKDKQRKHR
jgi:hypothetical protein